MKSLICAALMLIAWQTKAQACSRSLIDTLANQIDGDELKSIGRMQTAVAATRACARNPQMMAYAATKLAGRIKGDRLYSVGNSEALTKLCHNDPVCANALVKALGRAIDGDRLYSVGMTRSIARVVELNPFWSVQCSAIEAIAEAIDPDRSYALSMGEIIADISRIDVDPGL